MVWIMIILFFLIPAVLMLIAEPSGKKHSDEAGRENFGMNEILDECRLYINESVSRDYSELYLSREETLKREKQQARLKTAIREACLGDAGDREYLKEYIKDFLQEIRPQVLSHQERYIALDLYLLEAVTSSADYADFLSRHNPNISIDFIRNRMRQTAKQ